MPKQSTIELLLARQWVAKQTEFSKLENDAFQDASRALREIDKVLWSRLISEHTPWGTCIECIESSIRTFEDSDFERTLESLGMTHKTCCKDGCASKEKHCCGEDSE